MRPLALLLAAAFLAAGCSSQPETPEPEPTVASFKAYSEESYFQTEEEHGAYCTALWEYEHGMAAAGEMIEADHSNIDSVKAGFMAAPDALQRIIDVAPEWQHRYWEFQKAIAENRAYTLDPSAAPDGWTESILIPVDADPAQWGQEMAAPWKENVGMSPSEFTMTECGL